MVKFDLKKFRKDISVLKKQGLIGGKDFNVRTAQPWMLRGGKFLREYIKENDDILSGKATAVELDDETRRKYKRMGFETKRPKGKPEKVVIPHAATERISVRQHKHVDIKHPKGITRTQVPVEYSKFDPDALEKYLREVAVSKVPKNGKRYYAFNFFGNQSGEIFASIDDLIDALLRYDTVRHAINKHSAKDMAAVYRNFEIVTVNSMKEWRSAAPPKRQSKRDNRRIYRQRKLKLARGPEWRREEQREANRQKQQKYRDNLKSDPAALAEYKKDAKRRAKKSRKK